MGNRKKEKRMFKSKKYEKNLADVYDMTKKKKDKEKEKQLLHH